MSVSSKNPTFLELQAELPIADFLRLQSFLIDPEVKRYKRVIRSVRKRKFGNGWCGLVEYDAVAGKFEDPGEIKTAWLEEQIAFRVCSLAKSFVGSTCLIFQRNIDKSEDQPTGFRELCWIQRIEDSNG